MIKKLLLVLIVASFFSVSNRVQADVLINEVQIKPTGESFIELYNSDSSQDLTDWSLKRKTASGAEYSLVSASRLKDKSVASLSYFLLTNEDYAGDITPDATWAKSYNLANDNTLILYDPGGEVVDTISWGTVEENKSFQKTGSSWVVATPTPGEENETTSTSSPDSNDGTENSSVANKSTTPGSESKPVVSSTMKAKIISNNIVFAGQPFEMQATISGFYGENVVLGKIYWNFGDGTYLEQINNFEKFHHTYFYPGDYVVFFEYYERKSQTPNITSKMIIKAVPTTVIISKVGNAKDFFIELSNNASSDIDVSNWVLSSNGKTFTLPKNSVILSKKSITISSKITGFTYEDRYNLKLFSSTGELVFNYLPSFVPIVTSVETKTSSRSIKPVENTILNSEEEISLSNDLNSSESALNLEASAIDSDSVKGDVFSSYLSSLILTIFIGGSAGAVYFIRRKKTVSSLGDDFKILDE